MRKGCDGGKRGEKKREKKEKTDDNSGHYVIASSRPPERQPLEPHRLGPIYFFSFFVMNFFEEHGSVGKILKYSRTE